MSTLAKHFDTYDFIKRSKELGVDEPVAELQARQIEQAIDIAITTIKDDLKLAELATKQDLKDNVKELELKIEQTKNQVIIWVAGLFVASGLIQHFFK